MRRELGASDDNVLVVVVARLHPQKDLDLFVRAWRTVVSEHPTARAAIVGEGPSRAIYTFFYNVMIRRLFGVRMRDINFAFKLCRRTVFDHVTLRSEGSFIDVELLAKAQRRGFRIIQFGVDYFPRTRGVSTLSSAGVIRTILGEMRDLRHELKSVRPLDLDGDR